MNPTTDHTDVKKQTESYRKLRLWLGHHTMAYMVIIPVITFVDVYMNQVWQSYWLMLGWGAILLIHFSWLRIKLNEETWVQKRSRDLELNAYDIDHIKKIQTSFKVQDRSVTQPSLKDKG